MAPLPFPDTGVCARRLPGEKHRVRVAFGDRKGKDVTAAGLLTAIFTCFRLGFGVGCCGGTPAGKGWYPENSERHGGSHERILLISQERGRAGTYLGQPEA